MATQLFVMVRSVYSAQGSGVDDEALLRANIEILRNDKMYEFEVRFLITRQQSQAQREAALVAEITSTTQNQFGFSVTFGDLVWPWFR